MKRLNRSILSDYEIPVNRPSRLRGVQFGDDAVLLGLVDRLIDNANAEGADVGLAVVQPGETGFAQQLKEQDGLFTAFVRGVMRASKEAGSICSETGSISQSTTLPPSWRTPQQLAQ